ncbi:MAG: N-acetyltransferase [Clostridiales Family XIII bacterium]|jgi:UDP-2-acetamido-3-amino-2,3-dideoxy-glucuronate N-acetyltransferase|nr:N-acetyltransferase [Clostridiales Family XIII bacterium]
MGDALYFVHESSFVDEGTSIGAGTKIWHFSHIMSGCVIGERCNIGQNVVVSPGVTLGDGVKIQNNVSVYTGVVCEDDVFLGPSCVFTNVATPRSHVVRRDEYRQTLVRRGATVGANATIVCGHEIGAYAMVGAGAVVTKDVKPYELVVGNPAVHAGWVCSCGERLAFAGDEAEAACPACGAKYRLGGGRVEACLTK